MTQRTEQLLRPLQKNRQRCQRVSDTGVRSVLKNQQSIKSLTEHISTILVIPWMVEESCTSWKRWFIPLFIYIYIYFFIGCQSSTAGCLPLAGPVWLWKSHRIPQAQRRIRDISGNQDEQSPKFGSPLGMFHIFRGFHQILYRIHKIWWNEAVDVLQNRCFLVWPHEKLSHLT